MDEKEKGTKHWTLRISILLIVLGILFLFLFGIKINKPEITNFQECIDAGYELMKSNPPQCSDGKITWMQEISEDKFCGGVAGLSCERGYECQLDGNYQNAGGVCIKIDLDFCGSSTNVYCETNEDCIMRGCNSEICQGVNEEGGASICIAKACFANENYDLSCGCVNNQCMWD